MSVEGTKRDWDIDPDHTPEEYKEGVAEDLQEAKEKTQDTATEAKETVEEATE